MRIYYKTSVKFSRIEATEIVKKAKQNHRSIMDECSKTSKGYLLKYFIDEIRSFTPLLAVIYICDIVDDTTSFDRRCAKELATLAKDSKTINEFLLYIKELREKIDFISKTGSPDKLITLSTIHSAKGLEFDDVIIMDAYAGVMPKTIPDEDDADDEQGKHKRDLYQEERRLFYVAMTRAKNNLYIANIAEEYCPFVYEVFSNTKSTTIKSKAS